MTGKSIRMDRLFNRRSGRTIIVPMDHGVTKGPIPGLRNKEIGSIISSVLQARANAVLLHKGMTHHYASSGVKGGLIVHLSASTGFSPSPHTKRVVSSLEDAIARGADAVSVHVNLGDENEGEMLASMGEVTEKAVRWGMPVLAMVYSRGKGLDEFDPENVVHCARVAEELGADIVKVNYPGDQQSFHYVVSSVSIPVVIAGGEKMDNRKDLLRMAYDARQAGGAGLSIGRNIFQDEAPGELVDILRKVVHYGEYPQKEMVSEPESNKTVKVA